MPEKRLSCQNLVRLRLYRSRGTVRL